MGEKRTMVPEDLSELDIEILCEAAQHISHALLRARVLDILAFSAESRTRVDYQLAHLDALIDAPITMQSWVSEHKTWERGLSVARRLGKPALWHLEELEKILGETIRTTKHGFMPLQIADLLRRHGLERSSLDATANYLAQIAAGELVDLNRQRAYRSESAKWYLAAANEGAAYEQKLLEVKSLISQSEAFRASGGQLGLQAADGFERALKVLRTIPKSVRERMGETELAGEIARCIRECGAGAIGEMRVFASDPVDLTKASEEAREKVRGLPAIDALFTYSTLYGFAVFESEHHSAKKAVAEHPLQSLFSNVHFSTDGRVVHRSFGGGGAPVYGVDAALWRQMIYSYTLRINLLTSGVLWPAFEQVTNEHKFSVAEFAAIVATTGIVPADRTMQYAHGLHYGYDGDFSTAMQLLVPQFENIVRYHLQNVGIATTTISEERIELHVGLSALMAREGVEEILGPDLSFEIRALLCGPIGPNLRNEVAHGLLNDSTAAGAYGLCVWWIALRLVYVPFGNASHDTEAQERQEPADVGEREDDSD